MDNKLYVGNLSYDTSDGDLKTLFSQVGTVSSVNLIMDRYSGRSKGFAFIEMDTQSEAEEAIKRFNGYDLDGREIKVNIARPREERPSSGYGNRSGQRRGGDRNRQRRNRDFRN